MTASGSLVPLPVAAGVDGSENSFRAALYAAELARQRRAPLLLAHACPWGGEPDLPDIGRLLREGAEDLVATTAAAVRGAGDPLDVRTTVLDGYAVETLTELSRDVALIVLGGRGTAGVPGLLLGSTATGLVHHAHCPVVVLPDTESLTDLHGPVVVGVEGRPDDEEVLGFAVTEAAARGSGLVAVHAWRDVTLEASAGRIPSLADLAGLEAEEQRLLAEAVAGWRDKEPDVAISERVLRDRPAAALLDAAGTARLVVVGHRHRRALARLGSTTNGVLHRSPCPVAVVPLQRGAR